MANNHKHSPWRKSMLIPFWCIQILFMLLYIVLLGLALGLLVSYDNNTPDWDSTQFDNINDPEHVVHEATDVVVPVWVALCVICLILTFTEILLLARHKLRPLAFLIMNVVKTTVYTMLFILDIISAATAGGRTISVLGLIIDIIIFLSFWIPLIYGSVIYHRFRNGRTTYEPVDHPHDIPIHTSYESQFPKTYASSEGHSELESNLGNPNEGAADVEGRGRSKSFNHERDTRYDTYRGSTFSTMNPAIEPFESRGLVGGSGPPQIYVEHHDGETYEMDSRRELR